MGWKQRRLSLLAFVIFAGFLLAIQTLPKQTKSPENGESVKIVEQRKRGRHLSEDKEEEDDIRRKAKQETIRMLRKFAKGLR